MRERERAEEEKGEEKKERKKGREGEREGIGTVFRRKKKFLFLLGYLALPCFTTTSPANLSM